MRRQRAPAAPGSPARSALTPPATARRCASWTTSSRRLRAARRRRWTPLSRHRAAAEAAVPPPTPAHRCAPVARASRLRRTIRGVEALRRAHCAPRGRRGASSTADLSIWRASRGTGERAAGDGQADARAAAAEPQLHRCGRHARCRIFCALLVPVTPPVSRTLIRSLAFRPAAHLQLGKVKTVRKAAASGDEDGDSPSRVRPSRPRRAAPAPPAPAAMAMMPVMAHGIMPPHGMEGGASMEEAQRCAAAAVVALHHA